MCVQIGHNGKNRAVTRLRYLIATLATVGVATALAVTPALAHESGDSDPKPACGTALPLTTPCRAEVSVSGSNYTVTLPGVGTLTFSLDANNNVVDPVIAGLENGFTGTPSVDHDGVTATLSDAASSTATPQTYKVDVDVRKPATATAGTAPTVQATVKSHEGCDHDGDHADWDGRRVDRSAWDGWHRSDRDGDRHHGSFRSGGDD